MDTDILYNHYVDLSYEEKMELTQRYINSYQTPVVQLHQYSVDDELQEINPNSDFFQSDYIPFESFVFDETHKDSHKYIDKPYHILKRDFVTDRYPNKGFTPNGWRNKILEMNKKLKQPFYKAFYPNYNREACREIKTEKQKVCKIDNDIESCKKDDKVDILKEKHDKFMDCHNIRMIESFSNCKTEPLSQTKSPVDMTKIELVEYIKERIYGYIPINFRRNAMNHTAQKNQNLRAAAKCVDLYVDKIKNKQPHNVPVNYKSEKYRRTIRRIRDSPTGK